MFNSIAVKISPRVLHLTRVHEAAWHLKLYNGLVCSVLLDIKQNKTNLEEQRKKN
jgi:hypothetical protein